MVKAQSHGQSVAAYANIVVKMVKKRSKRALDLVVKLVKTSSGPREHSGQNGQNWSKLVKKSPHPAASIAAAADPGER